MRFSVDLSFASGAGLGFGFDFPGLYLLRITYGCGASACHFAVHILGMEFVGRIYYSDLTEEIE